MRSLDTVFASCRDIRSHAFRSALTMLGVIFGVAAVVAMMAVSEGAGREALREIEALGVDNLVIRSVKPVSGQKASEEQSFWAGAKYGVTRGDIAHIRQTFENVACLVPIRDTRKVIYVQGRRTDINCFATTPEFLTVTNSLVPRGSGRFLGCLDAENSEPVCVVGKDAARKIFSFEFPIGRDLRIGGRPFRVVGILESPNDLKLPGSSSINNQIYIPIETATTLFGKKAAKRTSGSIEAAEVEADYLYLKVRDTDQIVNTDKRLRTYLAATHKDPDYEMIVPYELLRQKKASERIFKIVLACIAGISLLVGGIGIMNIMMANVYERMKEIGTRRALGATKVDILLHFLFESLFLTILGGAIGMALGVGMARMVEQYAEMETVVTTLALALSMGLAVLVGVNPGTPSILFGTLFDRLCRGSSVPALTRAAH